MPSSAVISQHYHYHYQVGYTQDPTVTDKHQGHQHHKIVTHNPVIQPHRGHHHQIQYGDDNPGQDGHSYDQEPGYGQNATSLPFDYAEKEGDGNVYED